LIQEIKTFQAIAESVNIRRDHVVAASYCLCTALDEAAHKKAWGHSSDWAQHGLLVTLHGEGYGGEKVFLLAGRLSSQPLEHFNILELIYRLLSLGFEGRYTVLENGKAKLAALREQLFLIITEKSQAPTRELSLNWIGQKTKEFRQLRRLPWWVTATIALCIAVAFYHWHLRNNESYRSVVENQISRLSTKTSTTGAVLAQTLRLESLLQDEIQKGLVSIDSAEHGTGVTIKGDGLFSPGGEDVMSAMYPLLDKIAVEVSKVKGKVTIVGHTDNLPINTPKFPSNFELSKQRAQVVANRFILLGVDRSRIEVRGDGDKNPVADNASYIGRAKNRRVEVFVNEEK
jgi:type VI secretion system protein ImpK